MTHLLIELLPAAVFLHHSSSFWPMIASDRCSKQMTTLTLVGVQLGSSSIVRSSYLWTNRSDPFNDEMQRPLTQRFLHCSVLLRPNLNRTRAQSLSSIIMFWNSEFSRALIVRA
ncbi:hypothetical protein C8R43DRAFT_967527 [Mycena crocata]|nr:hypothetical protein C8R43DRAFT_967527 [Mycena crocata]